MVIVRVVPEPTDEEAAAVAAALEVLWPRPSAAAAPRVVSPAWRFSGRWWTGTAVVRRSRP